MAANFFVSSSESIDIADVRTRTRGILCPELRPVAEGFEGNIEYLRQLWTLPFGLISAGTSEVTKVITLTVVLGTPGNLAKWDGSAEDRQAVLSQAEQLRRGADPNFNDASIAWDVFDRLCEHNDKVRSSLRAMLLAITMWAWAAFETVAKDAWTVALNIRPLELGHPAFSKISDSISLEGLGAKHVSVGFLAKYGFDLRNRLGDVLESKFDFTSMIGIREAYTAAFGLAESIKQILSDDLLMALEATRHLIVHRAGIVDQEFQRRSRISAPIGQRYDIDGDRAVALCCASVKAGLSLLEAVDARLRSTENYQKKS
jgi:hypothetical protein